MSVLSLQNTLNSKEDYTIGTSLIKELAVHKSFVDTAKKVTAALLALVLFSSAPLIVWIPAVVGLIGFSDVLNKVDWKIFDIVSGKTTPQNAADTLNEKQIHLLSRSYMSVYDSTLRFVSDTTAAFSCSLDSFLRRT